MSNLEITKREVTEEEVKAGYATLIVGRKNINLSISDLFLSKHITKDSEMGTVDFTRLIGDMDNNKLVTLTSDIHENEEMHVLRNGKKCNCIIIKSEVARQVTERREDAKLRRETKAKVAAANAKKEAIVENSNVIRTAEEAMKTCITQKQYADIVKKSPSTIGNWRKKGFVQSIKIGRKVYIDMVSGFEVTYTGNDKATKEILRLHDASLNVRKEAIQQPSNVKLKEENYKLRKNIEELNREVETLKANEEIYQQTISSLNTDLRETSLGRNVDDVAKIEELEDENDEHNLARKELSKIINEEREKNEDLEDRIETLVERLEELGENEDGDIYVSPNGDLYNDSDE